MHATGLTRGAVAAAIVAGLRVVTSVGASLLHICVVFLFCRRGDERHRGSAAVVTSAVNTRVKVNCSPQLHTLITDTFLEGYTLHRCRGVGLYFRTSRGPTPSSLFMVFREAKHKIVTRCFQVDLFILVFI